MRPSLRSLLVILAAALPVVGARAAPPPAAPNAATINAVKAEAGKRGLSVLEHLAPEDLDGDGKQEIALAGKNEDGEVQIAVFRVVNNRATHLWTSPVTGCDELKSLQLRNMVGDKKSEIVADLREHAPDEVRRQLRVYRADAGGVRQILQLAHQEREKEVKLDTFRFGDDEPGYHITDLEGDGNQEVLIRREPKITRLKGRGGAPVTLIVGVKESVFAWESGAKGGGAYVQKEDRMVNFLPAYRVVRVAASSQKLPEELKKEEQEKALESGMNMAFDEGDLSDDKKAPANDDAAPVEVNPAPRAKWATDNDLDTAWVEDAKGGGEGEWLSVDLDDRREIRMVRIVPVCAHSEQDMKGHNDLRAFSLLFSGSQKVSVDRGEKDPSDSQIVAVAEVPAPGRKFAPQVLVFLHSGIKSSSVRVVIDKAKRRGKGSETCISELSVH